jgi:hypothetical protein
MLLSFAHSCTVRARSLMRRVGMLQYQYGIGVLVLNGIGIGRYWYCNIPRTEYFWWDICVRSWQKCKWDFCLVSDEVESPCEGNISPNRGCFRWFFFCEQTRIDRVSLQVKSMKKKFEKRLGIHFQKCVTHEGKDFALYCIM